MPTLMIFGFLNYPLIRCHDIVSVVNKAIGIYSPALISAANPSNCFAL